MSARLWIVWLMLALLPLRGLAVGTMQMPAAVDGMATHASEASHDSTHVAMPCHQSVGEDHAAGTGHACNLCDLCHGAVAAAPQPAPCAPPSSSAMARPAAAHDTGRSAVGGLERPPRPWHA